MQRRGHAGGPVDCPLGRGRAPVRLDRWLPAYHWSLHLSETPISGRVSHPIVVIVLAFCFLIIRPARKPAAAGPAAAEQIARGEQVMPTVRDVRHGRRRRRRALELEIAPGVVIKALRQRRRQGVEPTTPASGRDADAADAAPPRTPADEADEAATGGHRRGGADRRSETRRPERAGRREAPRGTVRHRHDPGARCSSGRATAVSGCLAAGGARRTASRKTAEARAGPARAVPAITLSPAATADGGDITHDNWPGGRRSSASG